MRLALAIDDLYLAHESLHPHPERPPRLRAIRDALAAADLIRPTLRIPPRVATSEELGRVHTPRLLERLRRDLPGKSGMLDADTYFCPRSLEVAAAAAGACVDVALTVARGEARTGAALVRPPGHHAEPDRAMGFCLLNNVAVAAAAVCAARLGPVAILDFDVHHGNGTQAAFYRRRDVLYLSLHQYPFYPGSGANGEIGEGEGLGMTANVPLPPGMGDTDYLGVVGGVFVPLLRAFGPRLLLLSAGYDAYAGDPLAGMCLSLAGYSRLTRRLFSLARELCDGHLVAVLEGGYDCEALGRATVDLVAQLSGGEATESRPEGPEPEPAAEPWTAAGAAIHPAARASMEATRRALARRWSLW